MKINWTDIIKYGMAIMLSGGLVGGGALFDRSSTSDSHGKDISALVQYINLIQAKDCMK